MGVRRGIVKRVRAVMNGNGGQGADAEILAIIISWCADVAPLLIILGLTLVVGGATWCVIRMAQIIF